ncbi:MAG: YfcC family protein, partial [Synergistaceae bacterium]|nr:YfcC family protein [Synergistaceae bacterium]
MSELAGEAGGKKKLRELPHIFVLLLSVIIVAMIATYVVPAGKYERVMDEKSKRMVIVPNSFQYVENTPVNPFEMFVSIEMGLIEASNITFLILAAFSCIYLIEKTGSIDAGIAAMLRKTKNNSRYEKSAIVILMVLFSIWGSTGTFSYEEVIAFVPIFVVVSIALGYDALVGLGISVVPVGMGFASATVNPFTIGVAQTISELPLFSGLGFRIAVLCVMTFFTIFYVLRYADRVKKDPSKSYVADVDYSDLAIDEARMNTEMTTARKLSLASLVIGVFVMGYGLIVLGWYINQVAAIFMIVAILAGVFNK